MMEELTELGQRYERVDAVCLRLGHLASRGRRSTAARPISCRRRQAATHNRPSSVSCASTSRSVAGRAPAKPSRLAGGSESVSPSHVTGIPPPPTHTHTQPPTQPTHGRLPRMVRVHYAACAVSTRAAGRAAVLARVLFAVAALGACAQVLRCARRLPRRARAALACAHRGPLPESAQWTQAGTVPQPARYPSRHGTPAGMVSQPARYPSRHRIPAGTVSQPARYPCRVPFRSGWRVTSHRHTCTLRHVLAWPSAAVCTRLTDRWAVPLLVAHARVHALRRDGWVERLWSALCGGRAAGSNEFLAEQNEQLRCAARRATAALALGHSRALHWANSTARSAPAPPLRAPPRRIGSCRAACGTLGFPLPQMAGGAAGSAELCGACSRRMPQPCARRLRYTIMRSVCRGLRRRAPSCALALHCALRSAGWTASAVR